MFSSTKTNANPLRSFGLAQRPRGIWLGFKKTAGLEEFSTRSRYSVWLDLHRNLVNNDPRYAVANARFQMQAVAVWVFALFTFFNVTYAAPGEVAILFSMIGASALGWLVFRDEQDRRNEAIGQVLARLN